MSKYSVGYTIDSVPGIYHCIQDGQCLLDAYANVLDHISVIEELNGSEANILWIYEIGCKPI